MVLLAIGKVALHFQSMSCILNGLKARATREKKDISLSPAIIKFDPSLRTAYCYKRHMLVGGFMDVGGWAWDCVPNKRVALTTTPSAYCILFYVQVSKKGTCLSLKRSIVKLWDGAPDCLSVERASASCIGSILKPHPLPACFNWSSLRLLSFLKALQWAKASCLVRVKCLN